MAKLAFIFIFLGFILLIIAIAEALKNRSFRNAKLCNATVVDTKTGHIVVNHRRRATYSLIVSYSVDGIAYESELPTTHSEMQNAVGKVVEIRYKDRNPKKIISANSKKLNRNVGILFLLSCGFIVFGLLFVLLR